jgi:DNA-binding GntR family transcriptional regulator
MANPTPITPTVQRIADALESAVKEGKTGTDGYLPSIRKLAEFYGVSLVTMWKAVNHLKEQGVLSFVRGHRITVSAAFSKAAAPDSGRSYTDKIWQSVGQQILADILRGTYRRAALLPSNNELQARYGVSFSTLKKALVALQKEGHLQAQGRGYTVPSITSRTSSAKIGLIAEINVIKKTTMADIDDEILRIIERECVRANAALEFQFVTVENDNYIIQREGKSSQSIADSDAVMGYLFISFGNNEIQETLLRQLARFKKPIAVFDKTGNIGPDSCARQNALFQTFAGSVGVEPGKKVAEYLLSLGHTNIAYISQYPGAVWSKQRLEGLDRVCRAYQGKAGVHPYVAQRDYSASMQYFIDASGRTVVSKFVKFYNQWKKAAPNAMVRQMEDPLTRSLATGEMRMHFAKLFEQALSNKPVSAWVAANDFLGILALDFLTEKAVAVPEKIALISYDNTLYALRHQLSSYDFNLHATACEMVNYILQPRISSKVHGRKVVKVPGMIVERRTT